MREKRKRNVYNPTRTLEPHYAPINALILSYICKSREIRRSMIGPACMHRPVVYEAGGTSRTAGSSSPLIIENAESQIETTDNRIERALHALL